MRQRCKSFQTACYQEQIIDWGNTINENYRPQKSLNKISALCQSIQSVIPQNLFFVLFVICAAQAKLLKAYNLLVQEAENWNKAISDFKTQVRKTNMCKQKSKTEAREWRISLRCTVNGCDRSVFLHFSSDLGQGLHVLCQHFLEKREKSDYFDKALQA